MKKLQTEKVTLAIALAMVLGIATSADDNGPSVDAAQDRVTKPIQTTQDEAARPQTGSGTVPERMEQRAERSANRMDRRFEPWSDRAHMPAHMDEKQALEARLQDVTARDDYRPAIERAGYQVTSVNENDRDELEYEIVKGNNSYEVQLEFDEGFGRATSIEVVTNVWKSDATRRALERTGAGAR